MPPRSHYADEVTLLAATVVAQTAYELFADPSLVEAAWDEFRRTAGVPSGSAGAAGAADGASGPVRARRIIAPARPAGRPMRTGGAPRRRIRELAAGVSRRPARRLPEDHPMAERPHPSDDPPARDFAAANGWDRDYEVFADFDLPTYVGPTTFMKLPWVTDPADLGARRTDVAIVGAPFDDGVSHRSGARFGPRAIREAQYTSGSINSLQLGVEPFEVLDRRRRRRRQHRAGLDRASPRDDLSQGPRGGRDRGDPDRPRRRPLDHLAGGHGDRRGPPAGQRSASSTSTPTPTRRTTTGASSPATARRCAG